MPERYEIPASRLEVAMKRLKRMQKRNPALGLPTPSLTVVQMGERDVKIHDALARLRGSEDNFRTVKVKTAIIDVESFTVPFGDWQILGYRWKRPLLFDTARSRFYSTAGIPADISAREELCCEHCQTRRQRASSYVLQSRNTKSYVEVGSTCMGEFLGMPADSSTISALSENADFLMTISDMSEMPPAEDDIKDEVETVIAAAACIINEEGFISSKDAGRDLTPTWRSVYEMARRYRMAIDDDDDLAISFGDIFKAREIILWLKDAASKPNASSFLLDAQAIIERGVDGLRDIAVLTALIPSHEKAIRKDAINANLTASVSDSSYLGMVGDRLNIAIDVRSVSTICTRYGVNNVITMTDKNGNLLNWFSSSKDHGLEAGKSYEINGTVGGHEIARFGPMSGSKQTVLKRVKSVMCLGATVEPNIKDMQAKQDNDDFTSMLGMLRPNKF